MNIVKAQVSALLAWVTALLGTAGSIYFSEFLQLPPCNLCWYQRIFMYPLVIIIAVGYLKKDPKMALYALPLSIIGTGISIYHNLLYFDIIPEKLAPCTSGVSCTDELIQLFGVVDIPLLSLLGFVTITILLILNLKWSKNVGTS